MATPLAEWIWRNGQIIPWEDANVHVTTHALHYGSSVFEGMRAYATPKGPAFLGLDVHVKRLFNSSKILRMDIPYSMDQITIAIFELVRKNGHEGCYIRPIVFRGAEKLGVHGGNCPIEVFIITFEWGRYLGPEAIEQGVDVMVSSWRRMAQDTFPAMAKAGGNYLNSQFIVMEAKEYGFTEGISLDTQGFVSEGSGENIFVVYQDVIYTPPMGASILMGITRNYVMTLIKDLGYELREQMIPRDLLYIADEVFFTGTAAEITPIKSIDHSPIGIGSRGPITKKLQDEFFGIVTGKASDRHGWLTYLNSV